MPNIGGSIVSILSGANSIDSSALVTQLVAATREPKEAVLNDRISDNSAKVSALSSAISSLDTFTDALKDVLKDSAFTGQPASNDPSIASVSLLPGGTPSGLPAQIEVQQLAASQILESANLADSGQPVGLGTLTLTTKTGSGSPQTHAITIDNTNNTLDGLAKAINDAKAGVTATVVTDKHGARLVLKGETGETNSFTLTKEAGDTADADLERFTFDGTSGNMAKRQSALDSIVIIDGVEMQNDSNELKSAIPFIRIDLNKAAPGTTVTLASTEPTKSTKDLVQEFVTAYNTLRSALNRASINGTDIASAGALASDSSIRAMKNELSKLTTTQLASTGAYRSLNDIGIKTNQDGTLSLDYAKLDASIAADPGAVARMIKPPVSSASDPGLSVAVENIRDKLKGESGPLTAAKKRYETAQTELRKQMEKLDEDMTSYEERLTVVYSRMAQQLNAFKATQSYLDQQVALWNQKDN